MDNNIKLSKFLSMVLRHKPEIIELELDEHGWADVNKLLVNMNRFGKSIDLNILKDIVAQDSKHRYSFNSDITKIRANQGHSIKVDVELKHLKPPDILYHGTATRFLNSIMKVGLNGNGRLYVHLSTDIESAISVGKRHGKPVVLKIDSLQMYLDGFKFYLSENNVWMCNLVPVKYINFS